MKIGIIGGGASGMAAAIEAAECGANVTILERNDRIGKKILVTGNGKCNLSNLSFSDTDYHSGDAAKIQHIFQQYTVQNTLAFFQDLGLLLKEKNGYIYPLSEQASAVLDVLRFRLEMLGVTVECGCFVNHIRQEEQRHCVLCGEKQFFFDRIILACGGCASPKTGSDGAGFRLAQSLGHKMIAPVPALVQLRCRENFYKSIAGIRLDACITLQIDGEAVLPERGELQLTEYGISGIPVFQLSRFASYALQKKQEVTANMDFMPDYMDSDLTELIHTRYKRIKNGTAEAFLTGILPKKLMLLFMKLHQIKPSDPFRNYPVSDFCRLLLHCKHLTTEIIDTNGFANAQICAGGVDLKEVSPRLESLKRPGVYFAGELLDVDGRCGGYNLQWAWSSGRFAGKHAAEATQKENNH